MKNRLIYISLLCACFGLPAVCGATTNNNAAFQENAISLNRAAAEQQQKNQAALQKKQKSFTGKTAQDSSKTDAALQQPGASASTPVINCDDPNDPNNYPTNYLYNKQQKKTYRLQPFAKCDDSPPSVTAPLSTKASPATTQQTTMLPLAAPQKTDAASSTTTQQAPPTNKWNIQY
jgi:hypothetical protein